MHVRLLGRRVPLALFVFGVACLLAVYSGSAALAVGSHASKRHPKRHPKNIALGGTWSGHYSGAFSGTFKVHWKQSGTKLRGTIALSNPKGTYGISGSVHGSKISFGAVAVGATYKGSVSGKSMSGTWKSPSGGGKWSAKKTS